MVDVVRYINLLTYVLTYFAFMTVIGWRGTDIARRWRDRSDKPSGNIDGQRASEFFRLHHTGADRRTAEHSCAGQLATEPADRQSPCSDG